MFNKKWVGLILCALVIVMFHSSVSYAHKVMIFGWVEGDRVNTISKFNGGKRVKNAPVSVYTSTGDLVLKGTTDSGGEFSFKRPGKAGTLNVVLEASMGHKTSCRVELGPEKASLTHTIDEPAPEKTTPYSNENQIEAIVEKAMDKKLAVILKVIAEQEDKQSLSEIISGIGYILGLVGVALWVRSR